MFRKNTEPKNQNQKTVLTKERRFVVQGAVPMSGELGVSADARGGDLHQ